MSKLKWETIKRIRKLGGNLNFVGPGYIEFTFPTTENAVHAQTAIRETEGVLFCRISRMLYHTSTKEVAA